MIAVSGTGVGLVIILYGLMLLGVLIMRSGEGSLASSHSVTLGDAVRVCLGAKHRIDTSIFSVLYFGGQRSSVVEQRTHKPLVGGPNPPAAIFNFRNGRCVQTHLIREVELNGRTK